MSDGEPPSPEIHQNSKSGRVFLPICPALFGSKFVEGTELESLINIAISRHGKF